MNTLLLTPYDGFFNDIEDELRKTFLKKPESSVIYVSLNKAYPYLEKLLCQGNVLQGAVARKRILTIDLVTKAVSDNDPSDSAKCIFLEPKNVLSQLREMQRKVMAKRKHTMVIVDSLSSLMVYNTEQEVIDFMAAFHAQSMAEKQLIYACNSVYFASLSKHLQSEKIKLIQEEENRFRIQFPNEEFSILVEHLERAVEARQKDKARELYRTVMEYYKKMPASVPVQEKHKLYKRCVACRAKI